MINLFKTISIYVKLYCNKVEVIRLDNGEEISRTAIDKFSNDRLVIADFIKAESFFQTIKSECLNRYFFPFYSVLNKCIDEYIHWYNTERLHCALGYLTPLEMEIKLRNLNQNVA